MLVSRVFVATCGFARQEARQSSRGGRQTQQIAVERLPPAEPTLHSGTASRINFIQHLRDLRRQYFVVGGGKEAIPEPRAVSDAGLDAYDRALAPTHAMGELIARKRRSIFDVALLDALTIEKPRDHLGKLG